MSLRDWQKNSWLVAHETSPDFWLNLQKLYELRLAETKASATIRRLPRLQKSEKFEPRRSQSRAA